MARIEPELGSNYTLETTMPPHRGTRAKRRHRRCNYRNTALSSALHIDVITALLLVFVSILHPSLQQEQDPTTLNGGSVLAMAGKECVVLAVDKRFGSGPTLVNVRPRPVLAPSPRLLVAFTGLEGDVQSLQQELQAQVTLKYSRGLGFGGSARNAISPRAVSSLTSHILYANKRSPYYVEPVVVGLEAVSEAEATDATGEASTREADASASKRSYRPYLCAMDVIGAKSSSAAFCCGGAATQSLYGTAEALWEPNLAPQELVDVCGKAFLSALERDCLSGYGAMIYLITSDGITEYDLVSRDD